MQGVFPQNIVGIDEQEHFATSLGNAHAARPKQSLVVLMENSNHCRITLGKAAAKIGAAVGRAVVDEHDLVVLHILRQEGRHALLKVIHHVAHRNDDREG